MSFSPCNKIHNEISLLSILLPSPLLTPSPRYLPSIEYFRVHWWLGAELLAFCQFFAPFTVGLRTGELPSRGWGSFRVQWSWNNARSGSFLPPYSLGVLRKLSEFFSVDFSTFGIVLDLPEIFKWNKRQGRRVNFGTVQLIFSNRIELGIDQQFCQMCDNYWNLSRVFFLCTNDSFENFPLF